LGKQQKTSSAFRGLAADFALRTLFRKIGEWNRITGSTHYEFQK